MAESVAGALSPRAAGKRAMDVGGGVKGCTSSSQAVIREEVL
jgi:hypothetical protein